LVSCSLKREGARRGGGDERAREGKERGGCACVRRERDPFRDRERLIHACMRVHAYLPINYMLACMHAIGTCTIACVHAYIYTCMHASACMHAIGTCILAGVHAYIYACMHVCN
jgi:hypothetical protein